MKKYQAFLPILIFITNLACAQKKAEPNKILIFLHEGVEILDFAGPMEVFIQAGFDVYTVGLTKEPLVAMNNLTVIPDYSVDDYPDPDIVTFYGGGGVQRKSKGEQYQKAVKEMIAKSEIQFSVCTGAFFLAENGTLDGLKATTFHTLINALGANFSKVEVLDDVRFVDNGNVITTAGISAGIDGALHLVDKIKGPETTESVTFNMEYDKWVRGEGLIIENDALSAAKKEGFASALSSAGINDLFKGEILSLAKFYEEHGRVNEAKEALEYVIENYSVSITEYNSLREVRSKLGLSTPISQNEFVDIIQSDGMAAAERAFKSIQKEFPGWVLFSPMTLNHLGYKYLNSGEAATAIEVFAFTLNEYPDRWWLWDSLGEAYYKNGQLDKAVINYTKSVELHSSNQNGKDMLAKIKAEQSGSD
ncbi:MAG: DJ-1/PfpI family protein [Cyclobacteriaceae bacterium]